MHFEDYNSNLNMDINYYNHDNTEGVLINDPKQLPSYPPM